jgi:glycosyltransferase involved in cell wall biosynthesis
MRLIDNPGQRAVMADFGYKRVTDELSWDHESKKLVNLYKTIFSENGDIHSR